MERKYTCDCDAVHECVVHKVQDQMLPEEMYQRLSLLYKMFGDETRIRLLHALSLNEMCVCDLAALLELTKSAVSHQLKALRLTNLVKFRKEGQVVYYSLADDHVRQILAIGLEHLQH